MKKVLMILLLFSCFLMKGQETKYGLHIQTFPHPAHEFTSLALENGNPIRTGNKETTLEFKVWNRDENVFGVVFRILTDQNKTIDLMYSVADNDARFPNLIINNNVYPLGKELRLDCWIDVTLKINPADRSIILIYDGEQISIDGSDILPVHAFRVYFGKCSVAQFELDNVASINLKDIRISQNGGPIREWDLRFHQDSICIDKVGSNPARIENGKWLIDDHMLWRRIHRQEFESTPSIAFDPTDATFYMANDDKHIYTYNCKEQEAGTINVRSGEFAAVYPNGLIYISEPGNLLSYNLDQNIYTCFDFEYNAWKNKRVPEKKHKENYWNNTVNWNPEDSTLISFGGYGHYQFNHELVISHPMSSKPQKRTYIKEIDPRRSAASVLVDSILYVFGGRGCPSGKQEMTQRYYYDLHAINIHSMQVFKLWEIVKRPIDGDFVPSSNMIFDEKNDCFYIMTNQLGGTMMRLDRNEPKIEITSLPIWEFYNAQHLYSNIYQSGDRFYYVFEQTPANGNSLVTIYEITSPAVVLANAMIPDETPMDPGTECKAKGILFLIIALAIFALIALAYRKKLASRKAKSLKSDTSSDMHPVEEILDSHHYDFSRQSICFFGGFKVKDRNGEDITDLFTPTLKSLLIILILYTVKNEKGLSGNKLLQALWFDKTEESAKNNRNVYMSKLRNILERIGDVKIVNQKGFWSICFEESTKCDYIEAQRLFTEQPRSQETLEKLVELLLRGVMLPNVEEDWVDSFKNDFSNMTIDFLTGLLRNSDLSDAFLLRIADTLFQHDFINEEALKVKCSILYKQGKKGLAKTVYDAFCKDYQSSLGTSFPTSMLNLINRS
jgi:DNA-binding SARP family transcriptional activator